MRTSTSTNGNTGKTRRAPVASTVAAVCMALPLSGMLGGTALAATTDGSAALKLASDKGNSATAHAAAAENKKDKAADATVAVAPVVHGPDFIGPVVKKKDAASTATTTTTVASVPAPVKTPFTNQGGVTTGSNTTKYETVQDAKGSTFTGKGGGKPSGDINSPQPYSNADKNNTGANDTSASNPYKSTRDGSPSLNGNGGGKQVGQPCAGCVGKADNKNPKGQAPGGSDHNAGYECDRNHGIGRSNPAHTACTPTTPPTTPPTTTPKVTVAVTCNGVSGTTKNLSTVATVVVHLAGGTTDTFTTSSSTFSKSYAPVVVESATITYNAATTDTATRTGTCPPDENCTPAAGEDENCVKDVTEHQKVTICHATHSTKNPFVVITVSVNSIVKAKGHDSHGQDVIPVFTYKDKNGVSHTYAGKNGGDITTCGYTPPPVCTVTSTNTCTPPPCVAPNHMVNGVCTPPPGCVVTTTNPCTPPIGCPAGTTMNSHGVCELPVVTVCPKGSKPLPNGKCIIKGDTPDQPVTGTTPDEPVTGTTVTPVKVINGSSSGPAAVERALPFTGTDALLLAQLAGLLLLVGGGLTVIGRNKKAIRTM